MSKRLFTSESVTEGHPDKMCDQISDAILDGILKEDPNARVAVETMATNGLIHVAGEVTTSAYVDINAIARAKALEIGYDSSESSFDGSSCGISISIGAQSPDIAQGVDNALETRLEGSQDDYDAQGAGDQGLMFGYASNDNHVFMPTPILLAHMLAEKLAEVRKNKTVPFLLPDGKTQVTLEYEDGVPVAIDTILISTQHLESATQEQITEALIAHVIKPVLKEYETISRFPLVDKENYIVNPTGKFVIGGPKGDAGLTGRKIIVDTYGGMSRHGGGAFSGKDPSKVDRSAAYSMRWIAKNIVAAGLADRVELQIAYAIGKAQPVGLYIETFGTAKVDEDKILEAVKKVFDLRPAALINDLRLKTIVKDEGFKYANTAKYGHFGKPESSNYPWEQLNRVEELKAAINE